MTESKRQSSTGQGESERARDTEEKGTDKMSER